MTATERIVADEATAAATVGSLPGATSPRVVRARPAPVVAGRAGAGHDPGVPTARSASAATVLDLLRERDDLPAGHPDRATLRTRSIEVSLPLARRLAARYQGRGEPLEDLYQVAALALVKAVDAFDPARQTAFSSYAVPTIVGALKRHFRDATWRLRMPRPIQDLAIKVATSRAILSQQLNRSPTLAELAAHLESAEGDVAVAREAWRARHPDSLDTLSAIDGEQQRPLIDTIGMTDVRLDAVIDRHALRPLLAALPARQRRILAMRYFADLTQAEIATAVGLSQMHISRLLARTLTQLRSGMLAEQSTRSPRASGKDPVRRA
jgi:RNA polymerase sigma-B factor